MRGKGYTYVLFVKGLQHRRLQPLMRHDVRHVAHAVHDGGGGGSELQKFFFSEAHGEHFVVVGIQDAGGAVPGCIYAQHALQCVQLAMSVAAVTCKSTTCGRGARSVGADEVRLVHGGLWRQPAVGLRGRAHYCPVVVSICLVFGAHAVDGLWSSSVVGCVDTLLPVRALFSAG